MNNKDAIATLARSSNTFGFDLYQRLRHQPGNLVMVPASLTTALVMAWGGARGETAEQMRAVLHLEGTDDEVFAAASRLSSALQDPSRPIIFRIANQLFGEKSYKFVPAFVEKTRAAFGAPLEALDFRRAPEASRVHINQWVEDKTEHRIKDLIPEGNLDSLTRLVLVNAIYFLGSWELPFNPHETRLAPFHLTASEKKDVPTMHHEGIFRVAWRDGVTALEVLYKGSGMSMVLLIPDEIGALASVEESLDPNWLDALTDVLKTEHMVLALPRFEVSPDNSLSLAEVLAALGMPLAFDPWRADFSGIASLQDSPEGLYIARVFHKGFVKVDEKGTEATATSAVIMKSRGPQPDKLKVDRPFLFLIRDHASGLILFLGRVSDPNQP